jgi:hypothetical protein
MQACTVLSALLGCGYLDSQYALSLLDTYDYDIHDVLDDVSFYRWDPTPHINDIIGATFERIAHEFLDHVVKSRRKHFTTLGYNVWTNCLDSGLWFDDPDLNRWYEAWRKI